MPWFPAAVILSMPILLRTLNIGRPDITAINTLSRVANVSKAAFDSGLIAVLYGSGLITANVPSKSVNNAICSSGLIILIDYSKHEKREFPIKIKKILKVIFFLFLFFLLLW